MLTYQYSFPISLTHSFQEIVKSEFETSKDLISPPDRVYKVHKYLIQSEDTNLCLIITPVYISNSLLSDCLKICQNDVLVYSITPIKYIGSENISNEILNSGFKINSSMIKIFYKKQKSEINILEVGQFLKNDSREISEHKIENSNSKTKNYFFLPVPVKIATETNLTKIVNFYVQEKKMTLDFLQKMKKSDFENKFLSSLFKTNPKKSDIKKTGSFVLLPLILKINETTLNEYINAIAPYLFQKEGIYSATPLEFTKWLKNSQSIIRNSLKKTISELFEDEFFEDLNLNNSYFLPLQNISKLTNDLSIKNHQEFCLVCNFPTLNKLPDLNVSDFINKHTLNKMRINNRLINGKIEPKELKFIMKENIKQTYFASEDFSNHVIILSHITNFEKSVKFSEFQKLFNFDFVNFENISKALQSSTVNVSFNYESYETIGDSVLKFITSLYLFCSTKDSEAEMSLKKDHLVGNKHLRELSLKFGCLFFPQTQKLRSLNFIPPNFVVYDSKLNEPKFEGLKNIYGKQEFGQKAAADIIESVIGAAFVENYTLINPLFVINKFNIFEKFDFSKFPDIFSEEILINQKMFNLAFEKESVIDFNASNQDLFNFFFCFIKANNLEEEINIKNANEINPKYIFKDPSLLISATDIKSDQFQRLEFFGDSILELYVISNIYKSLFNFQKEISPEILHNSKLAFLTSFQFSRFAVHFGLHKLISNLTVEKKIEVDNYCKNYDPLIPFNKNNITNSKNNVNYVFSSPDLEDSFEAYIGAVFLDGNWLAVHHILDPFLIGYFIYFAKFNALLTLDLKSDIYNFFVKKGIMIKSINSFENGKHVIEFKVYPEGEEITIGKGVASDEVTAAKIALEESARFIKKRRGKFEYF